MKSIKQTCFTCAMFVAIILFIIGCSSPRSASEEKSDDAFVPKTAADTLLGKKEVTTIFYNLPSPVEMSEMVKQTNAAFYPEFLNPVANTEKYTTTTSLALNLGILGVDMGYIKMFDQLQESLNYLTAVSKLSEKLGLPKGKGEDVYKSFEKNTDDKGTQLKLISELYSEADNYLKKNERQNIATLVVLGGWIEGLYLSSNIHQKEPKNQQVISRIAEQKYSLNTIIELVNNTQKDLPVFSNFLANLLLLKKVYSNVHIRFPKESTNLDTTNKVILLTADAEVMISDKEINDITRIIKFMRSQIVK